MRHLILGLILGVLLTSGASWASHRSGHSSWLDNYNQQQGADIERQNADAERHQQEMFRQEQRDQWQRQDRQRYQDRILGSPC